MDLLITYRHYIGNDLKYCIRSIKKYAKGIDTIYVVGDKPKGEYGVKHIPSKHFEYIDNKLASTWSKVLQAAKTNISEDFVLFSDDYFLTQEIDFTEYKNKKAPFDLDRNFDGSKIAMTELNGYIKLRLLNARFLKAKGYKAINYDLHAPMIFNKKKVIEVSEKFLWKKKIINGDSPYALKSTYGNYFNIDAEVYDDNKIYFEKDFTLDNPKIKKGFMFSIGNFLHLPETVNVFDSLYPEKAPTKKKEYKTTKEKKEYD
jgi:hypothetical protein